MKGDKDRRKHGDEVSKTLAPGEPPLLVKAPDGRYKFAKGHKRVPGSGRAPGTANHATQQARAMVEAFCAHGLEGAMALYDKSAKRSPTKALVALSRFLEFMLPKMRAVEETGPGGGPVVVEIVNLDSASTKRPAQESAVQQPPEDGE